MKEKALERLDQAGVVITNAATNADPRDLDGGEFNELLRHFDLDMRILAKYSLQWMIANNEDPKTVSALVGGITLAAAYIAIQQGLIPEPSEEERQRADDAEAKVFGGELEDFEGPVH